MGCGGSIYLEDGSIKANAGETKVCLDPADTINVLLMWPGEGSSVTAEVKKVIAGPDGLKEKWKEVGNFSGKKSIWVALEPATYQLRYVVDNQRILYPNAATVNICATMHKQYEKEPDKMIKSAKKGVEKDKEHPYNKEGGDDVVKKDLDAMKDKVSPTQLDDNLNKFKETLVMIEDTLPGNMCKVDASFSFVQGFFNGEEHVMAPMEKARHMAEQKMSEPANARKIALKTGEVTRQVVQKAMDGACKGLGTTRQELLPTLDDSLDAAEGRRPGGRAKGEPPAPAAGEAAPPPPDPKEVEAKRLEAVKKLFEEDKPKLKEWEDADAKSVDTRKAEFEKKTAEEYENLDKLLSTAFNPSAISGDGILVMARFKGKDMYEGLAQSVYSDGSIYIKFPENPIEEEETEYVPVKQKITVTRNGKPQEIEVNAIANLPPPAVIGDLKIGKQVRVKDAKNGFLTQEIVGVSPGDSTITVRDKFFVETPNVPLANVWTVTKPSEFSTRAHMLPQNIFNVEFWWATNEDDSISKREVNVWREGAKEESRQTVTLEKRRKPAKATKKEPNPTGDVFVGYVGKVKILPYRNYCYNFTIGDKTFVDFGKEAPTTEAYKRFVMKL